MVRLGGSCASGRAAKVEYKLTYSSWVLARTSAGCGLGQLRPESVERARREFDKQARAEPSPRDSLGCAASAVRPASCRRSIPIETKNVGC
jgi:hypothetical protein